MTDPVIEHRGVTESFPSHLGLLGGAVWVAWVKPGHTRVIHSGVNNAVESSHRSVSGRL